MVLEPNRIIDREIRDSFSVSLLTDTCFDESTYIHVVYNRVFILTAATGTIQVDQNFYPIKGDEIILVAKGQVFSFSAGTRLNGFEVSFGDCFWERTPASASNCKATLFNNAALNPILPLNNIDAIDVLQVCNMLLQEYLNEDYPNKLDAMAAYLKIIMIKLANILVSSDHETNGFDSRLYQRFLELVNSKSHLSREVSDFSRELSVPARKLSDVCRRKSGLGAKEIINGHIIAAAKRSLQFTLLPIKEIAYNLSFATPEQFSHFFKKNTGTAPSDYRNLFVNIGR